MSILNPEIRKICNVLLENEMVTIETFNSNNCVNDKVLSLINRGVIKLNQNKCYEFVNSNFLYEYGKYLLNLNQYELAIKCFRKCLDIGEYNYDAFLEVLNDSIKTNNYKDIYNYIDRFLNSNNQDHKNDCNFYLFILSKFDNIPLKYRNYVNSLNLKDIYISKDSRYLNVSAQNKIRDLAFQQKFISASIELKKIYTSKDKRLPIVRSLMHNVIEVQNASKSKILEFIRNKDYESIVKYLSSKSSLSLNDRYNLILSKRILKIISTKEIPKKRVLETDKLFTAIDGHNYELALLLSKTFSEQKKIDLNENSIYLLLEVISELINDIISKLKNESICLTEAHEEEQKEDVVDLEYVFTNLNNNNSGNAFKILKKYLISIEREKYEFLVLHLIKICALENDNSFDKVRAFLNDILNDEYQFDAADYLQKYYEAIASNNFQVAEVYINILDESHKLAMHISEKVDTEEQKYKRNLSRVDEIMDKIKQKISIGQNLIFIKDSDLNLEIVKILEEKVKEIPNIISFCINYDGAINFVVRKKLEFVQDMNVDEIIKEANVAYGNKDYDKSIFLYSKLFYLNDIDPSIYSQLGFCYLEKGNRKTALNYLKVATALGKAIDSKYDYTELIRLKTPIYIPKSESFEVDIDNYFGIDNIEQIVSLIIEEGYQVENACYSLGLTEDEKNVVFLILARECYYQEKYSLGDYYLREFSKVNNQSSYIKRLYNEILRNKKFYKNRDDSNHKKLNLFKTAKKH